VKNKGKKIGNSLFLVKGLMRDDMPKKNIWEKRYRKLWYDRKKEVEPKWRTKKNNNNARISK